jgi:hypothetical protein
MWKYLEMGIHLMTLERYPIGCQVDNKVMCYVAVTDL